MELEDLMKKSHKLVLEARSVDYLIKSWEFEETWGFANLHERNLLSLSTLEKVKTWMDAVRRNHIEILKTRELKSLARAMHIINYSRLTRLELQVAIWEHYESRKSNS